MVNSFSPPQVRIIEPDTGMLVADILKPVLETTHLAQSLSAWRQFVGGEDSDSPAGRAVGRMALMVA